MDPFPNPYSALIATFNQVSPLDSNAEDPDDPQHLNDDDLLLWANAEFTYDIPPGVGIYEEDLVAKIAQTQQQYEQLQRQHQQQLQQQQQFQQQQQQQPHLMASQPQQSLGLYHPTDIQRQMQQFDAIHRYLDSNEDPRTSLSVVERSRQRNPVTSQPAPVSQQQLHYDSRISTPTPFSQTPPTGVNPTAISPVAARLLRQPFLALQQQQLQQYSSAASSPLASPTSSVPDFHALALKPPTSKPEETLPPVATVSKRTASSRKESVPSTPVSPASPASSTTSIKATATPSEERANQLEAELEEYEAELEQGSFSKATDGLSQDDPDYAVKLAAEEDKRRRNTAASARFRHKKRLREQVLEKTAKEMTAKSEMLEIRVRELEMEIKWLRGLIVEKDSRMLDTLPASEGGSSTLSSSVPSSSTAKGGKESGLAKAPSKRGKKNAA
ncbi:hypothetical protein BGZ59_007813 [Podila verticillata]|nr:hypothetical protein BGZ59_007813 [Podila verticillata]